MKDSTSAVDLEIRVRTESMGSRTFLSYVLDSPSGVVDLDPVSIPSDSFAGSPDAYHVALIKKIEMLHDGLDVDGTRLLGTEIKSKLEGAGRDLYYELFPPPMRELYRKLRKCIKTLLIVSDEPWIPWELVKPYDDTYPDEFIDDDFLCSQFRLTRWLSGGKAAPLTISAGKIACVEGSEAPETTSLPCAARERALIASLAQSQPRAVDISPSTASYDHVEELLKTRGLGLLHIVSHGEFVENQPNESMILLADGRSFRATDLHGPIATRIGSNRPLVFLNAYRVARQGWSLTRLGGWVERWVRRCGCGCLVGPQWVVRDRLAYEFARTFYQLVAEGESLGEATWTARQKVREIDPGNPAWLAFSVFAHPGSRIVFAQDPDQIQGSPFTATELTSRGVILSRKEAIVDASLRRSPLPSPPAPYLAHRYTLLQTRSARAVQEIPLAGREEQLLVLLDQRPYLFVLDGLERIMIAYSRMDDHWGLLKARSLLRSLGATDPELISQAPDR